MSADGSKTPLLQGPPREPGHDHRSLNDFHSNVRAYRRRCTELPFYWAAILWLLFYISIGIAIYYPTATGWSGHKTTPVVDAVYFCVTTLTTVGYGDLAPTEDYVKVLCCLFVWVAIVFVASLVGKVGEGLLERQAQRIIERKQTNNVGLESETMYKTWRRTHFRRGLVAFGILVIMETLGIVLFVFSEGLSFVDALYLATMTITTVGLGDIAPQTIVGRVLTSLYMLCGTISIGYAIGVIASYKAESKQYAKLMSTIRCKLTDDDLKKADVDHSGALDESEFVLFGLVNSDQVDLAVVQHFRTRFRELSSNNVLITAQDLQLCSLTPQSNELLSHVLDDLQRPITITPTQPDDVAHASPKDETSSRLIIHA